MGMFGFFACGRRITDVYQKGGVDVRFDIIKFQAVFQQFSPERCIVAVVFHLNLIFSA